MPLVYTQVSSSWLLSTQYATGVQTQRAFPNKRNMVGTVQGQAPAPPSVLACCDGICVDSPYWKLTMSAMVRPAICRNGC